MTGQQLKNSILQMAVQGKLVPQDPNDEPASVLLEKIRKEKEKLIKEGKIKKEKNPSVIFRGADNLSYEKVGKNEPVCIADEVPFDIPDSWEWVRISEVFQIEMGQSPKGDSVGDYKTGMEFHQGKVFFGNKYINTSNQRTISPTKIAEPNSILLCVRAPVGKVNITDRLLCIGRGLCALKPLGNIDIDYAFYMFEMYENIFVKKATGTTFIAITGEVVKNQLVPLPPLTEQHRIVDKIKEVLLLVEQYGYVYSEVNSLNVAFPEQLKKSILQEAVQGKLVPQDPNDEPASVLLERIRAEKQKLIKEGKIKKDKHESVIFSRDNSHYEKLDGIERCIDDEIPFEIPESWEWVRLGTLFEHNTGKALNSANSVGTKLTYITTSNLYWDKFELDKLKEMLFTETEIEKCTVNKGDLLVCEGGDIGRAAIWNYDYPMRIQNHIHRLRSYITVNTKFYYYVFYLYKHAGRIGGKGIGIQGLSSKVLHQLLFPFPPLQEQYRIVETIDEVLSYCKEI